MRCFVIDGLGEMVCLGRMRQCFVKGGMAEMVVMVHDCNCFSRWQGFDGLSWLNGPNY